MSKVVRFHETGGPEVLKIEDVDIGQPGAGELRVNIEAIGLNRAEIMFRYGAYLEAASLPSGVGYEASGTVAAVGEGVTSFAPGDAICIIPAFSMNDYSVYGEEAIVPAYACTHRPEGLDAVQAAAIWMPYLTAFGALIDIAQIRQDEAVIIPAASSSVGLAAIQIALQQGAIPIATTRGPEKVDALKAAGATHVVTGDQDLAAEVDRITRGLGARVVFDPVAGPGVETLAKATGPGGTIFLYGGLAGAPTPFPLMPALQKGLVLRGYTLFEVIADPERFARGKGFVTEGLESGHLKPTIDDKRFSLNDIVEAHRYMESNAQFGKVVVTV